MLQHPHVFSRMPVSYPPSGVVQIWAHQRTQLFRHSITRPTPLTFDPLFAPAFHVLERNSSPSVDWTCREPVRTTDLVPDSCIRRNTYLVSVSEGFRRDTLR